MTAVNFFLKSAIEFFNMGLCVIPITPGQKDPPLIRWLEYKERRSTIEEIVEWWRKWKDANVGIVTGKISNLCVVDLDRYKEDYNPETELKFFDSIVTPTSTSPRGGTHLYFESAGLPISAGSIAPGIDVRDEGGYIVAPPSVNGNGRPYEWVGDLVLGKVPLSVLPEGFKQLIINNNIYNNSTFNVKTHGKPSSHQNIDDIVTTMTTSDDKFFVQGRRDNDIFHLANVMIKHKCDSDYIVQTLKMIALNCNPPFPKEELMIKIKSAMERANRKDGRLSDEIRELVLTTSDDFLTTFVYQTLNLTTRDDKKHAVKVLERLCKEKIIQRSGNKNGCFRLVDTSSPIIDIENADTTPFPLKMPFEIHLKVKVHASNIIIIAGESNSGKTALCMAICNMNRHLEKQYGKIKYFSSEMENGVELKIRLEEFGDNVNWNHVEFRFRTDNYPDVIDPDGLNIIDYMDEGKDEIYKMTNRIRAVGHKLRKGVVIICIQKSSTKDFGFGGEGTKNAARLYMTISNKNILKIEKAKIWASRHDNPNNQFIQFKLAKGCEFIKTSQWEKVTEEHETCPICKQNIKKRRF